ncbi:MAG: tetratricopeptide repeat protein, partial [Gammaproteobacteria bacterium]
MNLQQSLNKIRQHISLGEIESAEDMTRRLRRKQPRHKEVLFLEGCVQYQKGNFQDAIRRFRKLLDKQPDNLDVRMNLAVTLLGAGHEEEAASLLQEVTTQQPGNHLAWYNLGNACRVLGRNAEAREAYLQVLATEPAYAPACNNLSVVCRRLGDYRQAVAYGRRAVALQADAVFYTNLIIALIGSGLPAAYEAACEALQGEAPPMLQALSFPLMVSCCDWQRSRELLPHLQQAAHGRSVPLGILQDMLLSLNASGAIAPEVVFDIHRCWGEAISRSKAAVLPAACLPAGDDKLNIGYVSGDFSGHSVGLFINQVLAAHDGAHFRVHCYASNSGDDDMTRHIRQSVHQYRDIRDMSDEDFAAQVRRDGIHILVDLAGHTRNSRLAAFVLRPAPLQMTWLGYPNTTGLPAVD